MAPVLIVTAFLFSLHACISSTTHSRNLTLFSIKKYKRI
jgi:hypothetical protein